MQVMANHGEYLTGLQEQLAGMTPRELMAFRALLARRLPGFLEELSAAIRAEQKMVRRVTEVMPPPGPGRVTDGLDNDRRR